MTKYLEFYNGLRLTQPPRTAQVQPPRFSQHFINATIYKVSTYGTPYMTSIKPTQVDVKVTQEHTIAVPTHPLASAVDWCWIVQTKWPHEAKFTSSPTEYTYTQAHAEVYIAYLKGLDGRVFRRRTADAVAARDTLNHRRTRQCAFFNITKKQWDDLAAIADALAGWHTLLRDGTIVVWDDGRPYKPYALNDGTTEHRLCYDEGARLRRQLAQWKDKFDDRLGVNRLVVGLHPERTYAVSLGYLKSDLTEPIYKATL
jgi:hypothetical protein